MFKSIAKLGSISLMGCDIHSDSGMGIMIQTGRDMRQGKTTQKGLAVITKTMQCCMTVNVSLCRFCEGETTEREPSWKRKNIGVFWLKIF